jgi:hypothetical protein
MIIPPAALSLGAWTRLFGSFPMHREAGPHGKKTLYHPTVAASSADHRNRVSNGPRAQTKSGVS